MKLYNLGEMFGVTCAFRNISIICSRWCYEVKRRLSFQQINILFLKILM